MTPIIIGIIGIAILVIGLLASIPVAFIMAIVGFAGYCIVVSVPAGLNVLAADFFTTFSSYSLTVVPMFVLMGSIAFVTGISSRLYNTAYKFFGHMRGGLCLATIATCAGFAAICGSANAAVAAMGKVSLPEMKRYNYDDALATGSVAAGGTLGILIPPSTIFIIYGILTGQSIGKLFISGILPGILLSVLFMLTIYIVCRANPSYGPAAPSFSFKEKIQSLNGVIEMLVLFILVIGGLFAGVFTPTEAGGIGAAGSLIIGLVRRKISLSGLLSALYDTAKTTCMLFTIVAGATVFGHFLAVTNIPIAVSNSLIGLSLSPIAILMIIIIVYFIGGCFIDALPLILLTVPIFYPVVMNLGFNPIWFGVIIVLVTQIGALTPPVGICVYVINGIAKDVPLERIFIGTIPFLITMIICVLIIAFVPQISLLLPNLMS